MNLPTHKTKIEPVVVEGDKNEVISPEEIAESETAWQDYLSGKDQGISLEELEKELLGENLE